MIPKLYISRTADGNGFPLPSYSSKFHNGLNLLAAVGTPVKINPNERLVVPVGFAIGVPTGLSGMIVSDPNLAEKHGLIVSDAPHILNPADREPIFVLIQNVSSNQYVLHRGEVIAQLLIVPTLQVTWQEVVSSQTEPQTTEQDMIIDEGVSVSNPTERDIFKSLRRSQHTVRDRYKKTNDEV